MTATDPAHNHIIIVGGGTAGWMTAAALARFCYPARRITLVESDEIGTVGVGEATIPAIRNFNNALGIDEAEFIAATGGTFKLGIAFEGWGAPDTAYMHAFGLVGRTLGLVPFHHFWARGRAAGIAGPLDDYVYNQVAAAAGRFAQIVRPDDSPLPPVPYAFHFDAGRYARFLRGFAEQRGTTRAEGRIVGVERNGERGDVAAVVLADGTRVAGDLFVDCSGFGGLLIERELNAGFEDWSHWLPCDRAVAAPSARAASLAPYTRAIAHHAGWRWRIPLQHRTGNGVVFCSAHMNEDEASAQLLANLGGEPLAEPRVLRFVAGKRRRAFIRNVVAIGLSSGFLEPLESTSIHLIQTGVNRLLDLLPAGPVDDATRDEFNRQFDLEIAAIRDFIILHYHANGRHGEPLWDAARTMALPESLAERIALFRREGRVFRRGDELFDVPGWVQVMIGQGILPKRWHPIVDQIGGDALTQFLGAVREGYVRDVARLPDHAAYVARIAPMKEMVA